MIRGVVIIPIIDLMCCRFLFLSVGSMVRGIQERWLSG